MNAPRPPTRVALARLLLASLAGTFAIATAQASPSIARADPCPSPAASDVTAARRALQRAWRDAGPGHRLVTTFARCAPAGLPTRLVLEHATSTLRSTDVEITELVRDRARYRVTRVVLTRTQMRDVGSVIPVAPSVTVTYTSIPVRAIARALTRAALVVGARSEEQLPVGDIAVFSARFANHFERSHLQMELSDGRQIVHTLDDRGEHDAAYRLRFTVNRAAIDAIASTLGRARWTPGPTDGGGARDLLVERDRWHSAHPCEANAPCNDWADRFVREAIDRGAAHRG